MHLLVSVFVLLYTVPASVNAFSSAPVIVPEVHPAHVIKITQLVQAALGDEGDASNNRYAFARDAVTNFQENDESPPSNELVYGELSVEVLATILDAVGVQENDVFLDIGSGDGALVLGASLLYADTTNNGDDASDGGNAMKMCYGVDIVPGLVDRSISHADNLHRILQDNESFLQQSQANIELLLGDIHQPDSQLQNILEETTIAVCFATTWSAENAVGTSLQGRKLPKLSKALSRGLSSGCRVVIIDGKLDEEDGFHWMGDLRIFCPDTAPYSVATLYHKQ
mmetsp:Transcript_7505/g.11138  ORF Transcript_7505/g.11138 Transcript_7505/m.11138 type:complete len:283 (+) Transcript_7505:104-952(+)